MQYAHILSRRRKGYAPFEIDQVRRCSQLSMCSKFPLIYMNERVAAFRLVASRTRHITSWITKPIIRVDIDVDDEYLADAEQQAVLARVVVNMSGGSGRHRVQVG